MESKVRVELLPCAKDPMRESVAQPPAIKATAISASAATARGNTIPRLVKRSSNAMTIPASRPVGQRLPAGFCNNR
jgi:hypothetical protein